MKIGRFPANEVKIRVPFQRTETWNGSGRLPYAASPFIDEDFNGEWQMFTPRQQIAARH